MKKLLLASILVLGVGLYLIVGSSGGTVAAPAPEPSTLRYTTAGPVLGFDAGHGSNAWLGIPYAAAPVGPLRWRAPHLPDPWLEPRPATAFGAPCPQFAGLLAGAEADAGGIAGQEDCLTLNVWAPRGAAEGAAQFPVMVWIHGGGNTSGSTITYPMQVLAGTQRLVVVSLNYRLGLLGWFSHPALRNTAANARDASGNYGTLDLVAGLQWVQNNIAQFGGDPDRVTVFGESAGGRNVYSLLASPLARGLFVGAIAQSGSTSTAPLAGPARAPGPLRYLEGGDVVSNLLLARGESADVAAAQARQSAMNDAELAAFLRERSVRELLESASLEGQPRPPQLFRDGVVLPERPLLEVFGDPAAYNAVPLLAGSNRDEQKLYMAQNPDFVRRWFGFLPRIRDRELYTRTAAYISDQWKLSAVNEPAALISAAGGAPVYTYRWDWDEQPQGWLLDGPTLLGAAHGFEIPFVMGQFDSLPIPYTYTEGNREPRERLSRQMMSYWAEFAYSGKPGRGRGGELPEWPAWQDGKGATMILDTDADGGLRPEPDTLDVAALKQRLFKDPVIASSGTLCALYKTLFINSYRGARHWDGEEYLALGCEPPGA